MAREAADPTSFVISRGPEYGRRPMRLVLALWAAAIYAIYWLGYLRGQP